MKSINMVAQENGDTTANEASRIRERNAAVARAWRTTAYNDGERSCSASRIAEASGLPVNYVIDTCSILGLPLVEE